MGSYLAGVRGPLAGRGRPTISVLYSYCKDCTVRITFPYMIQSIRVTTTVRYTVRITVVLEILPYDERERDRKYEYMDPQMEE